MDFTTIRNQHPFELPAHLRLQSLYDLKLFVPVGILAGGDKPISELVILNDDQTDIGIIDSPTDSGRSTAFVIFLKQGQEFELGKSTEVMVDGLVDGEMPFRVSENQHAIN